MRIFAALPMALALGGCLAVDGFVPPDEGVEGIEGRYAAVLTLGGMLEASEPGEYGDIVREDDLYVFSSVHDDGTPYAFSFHAAATGRDAQAVIVLPPAAFAESVGADAIPDLIDPFEESQALFMASRLRYGAWKIDIIRLDDFDALSALAREQDLAMTANSAGFGVFEGTPHLADIALLAGAEAFGDAVTLAPFVTLVRLPDNLTAPRDPGLTAQVRSMLAELAVLNPTSGLEGVRALLEAHHSVAPPEEAAALEALIGEAETLGSEIADLTQRFDASAPVMYVFADYASTLGLAMDMILDYNNEGVALLSRQNDWLTRTQALLSGPQP